MSSQVSDLYKKYNDLIEELKSIRKENKDLLDKVDKVRLENKDLQSEIILLVKQMATLEKLVHTKYMNSGPGAPKVYEKNYDDVGKDDDTLNQTGSASWTHGRVKGDPLTPKPRDRSKQYYIVNPRTKQIIRNPDYKPADANDHFDDSADDDVPF